MKELKDYTELRSHVYKVLAFPFYKEADAEYLEDLQNLLPYLKNIATLNNNSKMTENVQILEQYFAESDLSKEVEELACAYARIFLVADMKAGVKGVSAHESVYTSTEGLLMQDARDEVLEIYYSENLANNREVFHEMEDHLSAEMYFIARLCDKILEALDTGDGDAAVALLIKQKDFLEKHPLRWIDAFTNDIVEISPSIFYKGLANITAEFIHTDKKLLDSLLA